MVSKVAVMAIVGILAVPILLGYALNIDQVTETDYKSSNDPINVTSLLANGTGYTTAQADTNELNTNFTIEGLAETYPEFQRVTQTRTSIETAVFKSPYVTYPVVYSTANMARASFFVNNSSNSSYIRADVVSVSGGTETYYASYTDVVAFSINDIHGYKYVQLTYTDLNNTLNTVTFSTNGISSDWKFYCHNIGDDSLNFISYYNTDSGVGYYADISSGFKLPSTPYSSLMYPGVTHTFSTINFPANATSALITINLSSITDSNYKFAIDGFMLEKTTIGSDVTWAIKDRTDLSPPEPTNQPIYYDKNSINNTYQLLVWADQNSAIPYSGDPSLYQYTVHYDFRYVGAWPTLIGEANYFKSYDIERVFIGSTTRITGMMVGGYAELSPLMRVDAASYRAMEIPMITDQNYDPAAFKNNPATTINDPTVYGHSFTFGGNTYTVKNGNITMGTHDIPVKGLVLSSVPNQGGGYDNKIGNTVISTTADPSTITFNGKWSASISTVSQEEYEFTKNEWKAGSFAWDGIDQNFLMVGLLASLGAFIALGIYARRSKATIWPLLIVCGGAALLFFVML